MRNSKRNAIAEGKSAPRRNETPTIAINNGVTSDQERGLGKWWPYVLYVSYLRLQGFGGFPPIFPVVLVSSSGMNLFLLLHGSVCLIIPTEEKGFMLFVSSRRMRISK